MGGSRYQGAERDEHQPAGSRGDARGETAYGAGLYLAQGSSAAAVGGISATAKEISGCVEKEINMEFDLFNELLQSAAEDIEQQTEDLTCSTLIHIESLGRLHEIADRATVDRCLKKLLEERREISLRSERKKITGGLK